MMDRPTPMKAKQVRIACRRPVVLRII